MTPTIINFFFSICLLGLLAVPIGLTANQENCDFPSYYVTAKRIQAGEAADVYVIEHQREAGHKIFPQNNPLVVEPPYALWAVAPMAWTSADVAKVIYTGLLIIWMSASFLLTARVGNLTSRATLILLGTVVASGPVFEILRISKPIPLFLLGLTNSLLCLKNGQEVRAGLWLVLCLFKPQEILPFLFFLIGGRRFKVIASCGVLGLTILALSFPLFGKDGYVNFYNLLSYINQHPELPGTLMMPVLKGQLLRSAVGEHNASLISSAVFVVTLLSMLVIGWYKRSLKTWWLPGAICSFAGVAWSIPYMHLYDLIIVIPGLCFLIQLLRQKNEKLPLSLVLVALVLFMQPVYSYLHYYYLMPQTPVDLHFCGLLLIAAVAIREVIVYKEPVNN